MAPATSAAAAPTCNSATVYQNALVPSVAATGSVNCVMGQGANSHAVLRLQWNLNTCHGKRLAEDGQFGPRTRQALIEVQRSVGARADGVYGPETRSKMLHMIVEGGGACKRVS